MDCNDKNTGLRALIEACELDAAYLSAYHIGFIIGPCLNASGRLDTAQRAIELLLCTEPGKAHEMAQELRELNEERKNMTDTEAKKQLKWSKERICMKITCWWCICRSAMRAWRGLSQAV